MAFKVLTSEGVEVSRKELNMDAASFFNVPYKEGKWTSHIIVPPMDINNRKPYIDALRAAMDNNWFVKLDGASGHIGYKDIANWVDIRNYIRTMYMNDIWDESMEWQLEYYKHISETIKPIDDLFKYWAEKGYKINLF